MSTTTAPAPRTRRPLHRQLYAWVLGSILLGALFGVVAPERAAEMKWLADLFITAVKLTIAPLIFCTIVVGIAGLGNLSKAGGIALRTLGYFLVMTVAALAIGLLVANVVGLGQGANLSPDAGAAQATLDKVAAADQEAHGITGFLTSMVPSTFLGAFATENKNIQVVLLAVLVAIAVSTMGERGAGVVRALDTVAHVFFGLIRIVMYASPFGAFAAMAYTVGTQGAKVLGDLAGLMGAFYLTCAVFVLGVLGLVCRVSGFSVLRVLRLIRDELVIVLGTSSSETVLPRLMAKLEASGVRKSVVGLTVPTGYSFNLDGTMIYLTMGALFIANATGNPLSIGEQVGLLLLMMVMSKGAAGVTGAGLVTLAAGLSVFGDGSLAVGIALVLGIDRFMSEARAITNVIGNTVATLAIARWEGALDADRLRAVLHDPSLVREEDLTGDEVAAPVREAELVGAGAPAG